LFLFAVLVVFSLSSQELESDDEDQMEFEVPDPVTSPDNDRLYVITDFEFDIQGRSRPFALLYNAELEVGEKIYGQAALDRFIADKTQMLINQRVLKDNVIITHAVGEQLGDGSYPVILTIKVEDSRNIVVLPKPKYSSSSGLDFTVNIRDYNFLGTMSPLRLDIGYSYDEEKNHSFNLMLDTDTPFKLFGLYWIINFDHDFSYRANLDEPFYYKNTTGLSVEFPVKRTILTIGFDESLMLNQENERRYRDEYGRFQEGIYMSSNPYISWKIPTGYHYYDLGEVTYTPKLSATFNHEFSQWPLPDFNKGPFLNFSHSLSFGRVDWVDNLLKGVSVEINNSFSYDFYKFKNDINPWGANLHVSGIGHKIISERVSFSARMMYRHWFFDDYTDSGGDVVRGIIDNNIIANSMFSVNLDMTFKLFRFLPSVWFNKEKASFMNFDFHVSPFIDLASYNNPVTREPFGLGNMLLGSGLEVIIFPQRWRSLFLRMSAGLGIQTARLSKGFSYEIFIGTALHY
jgi:hypothetical protein